MTVLKETTSLCPVCFTRLPATYVTGPDGVYMEKHCATHGIFHTCVWEGSVASFVDWTAKDNPPGSPVVGAPSKDGCPYDCGLCATHRQKGCCLLLEVTARCNLQCPVCFAMAGEQAPADPTLADIAGYFDRLMALGGPFNIQLSGGEPTMRDDLADIIRLGRSKGFTFFQLNTNGVRLAEDTAYVKALAEAGLNTVFLQFDGLQAATHVALRGRDLRAVKEAAITNCAEAGLGVVLVPVLHPEVNLHEVGDILTYALQQMPVVRGVHFQPMAYFGRYPETATSRVTLPRLIHEIDTQTAGRFAAAAFIPPNAEHPLCSFHADFLLHADGSVQPLYRQNDESCCSTTSCCTSDQARTTVAKRWSMPEAPVPTVSAEADGFEEFLARVDHYTLAVSAMFFQDAWNMDLDRLQRCYIIEWDNAGRRMVPFCAYNITDVLGGALHRGKSTDPQEVLE